MSHGLFLLDTSIVLQLVRDKELGKRISAQFGLADAVHCPLISIVTVGEIWALADQFDFGVAKRELLKSVLETLVILDINDQSVLGLMWRLTVLVARPKAAPGFSRRMTCG